MKRSPGFVNLLVVVATVCVGLILGEIVFRMVDGYRLDRLALILRQQNDTDQAGATLGYAKRLTLDPSFNLAWYTTNPQNYDRSPKYPLPADWVKAVAQYKPAPDEPAFVQNELKFLYNYNWL